MACFDRDQLLTQGLFQRAQAAPLQQCCVTLYLRKQPLLRGNREYLIGGDAQQAGALLNLRVDFGVDLRFALDVVPKAVDLVERDQATALRTTMVDMATPTSMSVLVTPASADSTNRMAWALGSRLKVSSAERKWHSGPGCRTPPAPFPGVGAGS